MQIVVLSAALALVGFAAAQAPLPECAIPCFTEAIGNTTCSLVDTFCQCTTGHQKITDITLVCLCTAGCTDAELLEVQQDTNQICSSALAASHLPFTPVTAGLMCSSTAGAAMTTAAMMTASSMAASMTASSAAGSTTAAAATTGSSGSASTAAATTMASSAAGTTAAASSATVAASTGGAANLGGKLDTEALMLGVGMLAMLAL